MSTTTVPVLSPLDGWATSLDEVPDPVFAGRMLGDGLAIDPTSGVLLAPCAGEVIALAATSHAVSIRAAGGVEIMLHVGIDTVGLAGRGFVRCAELGQRVIAGQELIRLDLDTIARGARSLLTPIVVANGAGRLIGARRDPGPLKAGDVLFQIAVVAGEKHDGGMQRSAGVTERVVTVRLKHGLHARPAAVLAQSLKEFAVEAFILAKGGRANARSITAILALGIQHGDSITLQARGADGERALAKMQHALVAAAQSEAAIQAEAAPPALAGAPPAAAPDFAGDVLRGTPAVPGFALGRVVRLERRDIIVEEAGEGEALESDRLERARAQVRARLARVGATGNATRREIALAHVEFLDDPVINEAAQELITTGKSAGYAWRTATRGQVHALEALADPRLRERADDLLDVESHVLLALAGEARPLNQGIPEGSVVVADDLLPSELSSLDPSRLAALCLGRGGATSHVAILAAAMDVPMIVGLGDSLHELEAGAWIIVDADAGEVRRRPAEHALDAARSRVAARSAHRAGERAASVADCHAADGTRIEVFANVGSEGDARAAVLHGAEGCGLLRTEFLFIEREAAPDENEQQATYQAIAAALGGRPLVVRLMDIGGDKPLPYLPLPHEENPALGLRGIRTALARPDLLRTQLRAALRVVPRGVVQLLLPMVTDVVEVLAVRAMVSELDAALGVQQPLRVGAMIETPAAALNAANLLKHLDFISIGSNDLTQYTLAMDRGHPAMARQADAMHPAVLQLIALAASAGAAAGKTVAICGGIAADRTAIPILLGLGLRELSVVPAAIPAVKRRVRALRIDECRALAQRCLGLASAAEVRALVADSPLLSGNDP